MYAYDNSSSAVSGSIFSMKYQLFLNDFYNFGSMEILNYYMVKQYLETLDFVIGNFKPVSLIRERIDCTLILTGIISHLDSI